MMNQMPTSVIVPYTSVQDAKPAGILGALQIFLALIILILLITISCLSNEYSGLTGMSFVAPAVGIITGSFGVYSSKTKSKCFVTTTMLLSFFAALVYVIPALQGGLFVDDERWDISYLWISTITLAAVAALVAFTLQYFCVKMVSPQPSKTKPAGILGTLQIFLSLVILILLITITIFSNDILVFTVSFVTPSFGIITGSFGVYSSKTKSRCSVITTMVLSIFAAIFHFLPVFEGARFADVHFKNHRRDISYLCISTATLGLVAAVVAITQSAFCCQGCCCQPSQKPVTTAVQGNPRVLMAVNPGTNGASAEFNGSGRKTPPAVYPDVCAVTAASGPAERRDSKRKTPLAEYPYNGPYSASGNAKRGDKRIKTKDLYLSETISCHDNGVYP